MRSTRQAWSWRRTRSPGRPRPTWRRALAAPVLAPALLLALLLGADPAPAGVSIVDDEGRRITLDAPATRVIALYAALSDMVAALGKTDALIARTRSETEPPAVAKLPCIGTHMRPSVEMTAGLKPDLVLQMGARARTSEAVAAIERLGVPVAMFQANDFDALFSVVERVATLLGARENARGLIRSMQDRLDQAARRVDGLPRPRVFFEVRYPNLLAAGRGSMVSEVIRRAGGTNCVPGDRKLVRLSEEELLRLDPDVYILQKGPMNSNPMPPAERPHYRTLQAVQSGRTLVVDERLYSRPSPRAVEAVEQLAEFLHPQTPNQETQP